MNYRSLTEDELCGLVYLGDIKVAIHLAKRFPELYTYEELNQAHNEGAEEENTRIRKAIEDLDLPEEILKQVIAVVR